MVVKEAELLVIGGGLAGLIAAREAANSGVKPTVLYSGRGASTDVFGINILGLRRPELKDDSYKVFLEDTLKSGCGLNNKDLVETLVANTEQIADTISLLGLDINDSRQFSLTRPLGCSYPRCVFYNHNKSIGIVLLRYLKEQIENSRGQIISNIEITHLLKDGGRIVGAYGFNIATKESIIFKARAVVLATGGLSNLYDFTTTFKTINGNGSAMAFNIGAELIDMEFIQFEPAVCIYPESVKSLAITTTMLNDGAKMYNKNKEAFISGTYPNKNELSLAMYKEIVGGKGTEHGGIYFDATMIDKSFLETAYPGFIKKYQNGGIDIREDMLEVAPAAHYSCGGVKIDKDCSTSIKGLYACGEVIGGLHGANRLGGNAGAETLVFGKIAGENASVYAKNTTGSPDVEWIVNEIENSAVSGKDTDSKKITSDLRNIVSKSANVIRSKSSIRVGLDKLLHLEKLLKSRGAENSLKYFNILNMITVGKVLLTSADYRKESRGTHCRQDYPKKDDRDWLKNIIIKKDSDSYTISTNDFNINKG